MLHTIRMINQNVICEKVPKSKLQKKREQAEKQNYIRTKTSTELQSSDSHRKNTDTEGKNKKLTLATKKLIYVTITNDDYSHNHTWKKCQRAKLEVRSR